MAVGMKGCFKQKLRVATLLEVTALLMVDPVTAYKHINKKRFYLLHKGGGGFTNNVVPALDAEISSMLC